MSNEIPEDVTNIQPTRPVKGEEGGQQTPSKSFKAMMNEGATPAEQPSAASPYDLAGASKAQTTVPTFDSLQGQMETNSGVLGDIQNQLHTKNLKLKQSQKYLLRNKLSDANAYIRSAASKTGVKVGAPPSTISRQNPIMKFIGLVSDSQNQLASAQKQIQAMKKSGGNINPGDMLLVQVKLAKAQQELEYSSVLLSKAVDDIKMIFNIQI